MFMDVVQGAATSAVVFIVGVAVIAEACGAGSVQTVGLVFLGSVVMWLAWATWRVAILVRRGAHRGNGVADERESLGFAIGAIAGIVLAVVTLSYSLRVEGPGVHIIGQQFELALDFYRADVGRYPSATQGLRALLSNPGAKGWAGPYVPPGMHPYVGWFEYRVKGDERPVLIPRREESRNNRSARF
jgi:general secretion pathway protein G